MREIREKQILFKYMQTVSNYLLDLVEMPQRPYIQQNTSYESSTENDKFYQLKISQLYSNNPLSVGVNYFYYGAQITGKKSHCGVKFHSDTLLWTRYCPINLCFNQSRFDVNNLNVRGCLVLVSLWYNVSHRYQSCLFGLVKDVRHTKRTGSNTS